MQRCKLKYSPWLSANTAGGGLGPPTRLEIESNALAGRGFPPPPKEGARVLKSMDPTANVEALETSAVLDVGFSTFSYLNLNDFSCQFIFLQ